MKKLLNSLKIFAIVLLATFTLATTAQSFTSKLENPAELKYVGTVNNHPRLQLNFNNNEADEFFVTITDQFGATLFAETVSGKQLVRTYQLDTDELDASIVNFHVYSKKNNNTAVYKVNNNPRFVQDVVINRK